MSLAATPAPRDAVDALLADLASLTSRNTAAMRKVRRLRTADWKDQSPHFIISVARELQARRVERWLGCELIRHHAAAFALLDDRIVDSLSDGLDSWDSVDRFARILSGPAWVRGRVSDTLIEDWTFSADRWRRRAALVSTVALNSPGDGGTGDVRRTLAVCGPLADDRDDMVEKALSWALRALSAWDRAAVVSFVAEAEPRLAARVKREARNKLATGLKTPKRVSS